MPELANLPTDAIHSPWQASAQTLAAAGAGSRDAYDAVKLAAKILTEMQIFSANRS